MGSKFDWFILMIKRFNDKGSSGSIGKQNTMNK